MSRVVSLDPKRLAAAGGNHHHYHHYHYYWNLYRKNLESASAITIIFFNLTLLAMNGMSTPDCLSPSTSDSVGQISLCLGSCTVYFGIFGNIPGYWSDISSISQLQQPKISLETAKYPLGGRGKVGWEPLVADKEPMTRTRWLRKRWESRMGSKPDELSYTAGVGCHPTRSHILTQCTAWNFKTSTCQETTQQQAQNSWTYKITHGNTVVEI